MKLNYLNPLHCDHITGEITCRIIIIQTVYIHVYRKKNLPFIFATKMEQQHWGIKTTVDFSPAKHLWPS